jgi:ribosomal protein S27AE
MPKRIIKVRNEGRHPAARASHGRDERSPPKGERTMIFSLPTLLNLYSVTDGEARHRVSEAKLNISELEDRVDRLSLLSMALWTLLREQLNLTDEQLAQRVQDIDLSDGKLDGRISTASSKCEKCGRMLSARHVKCIYCGRVKQGISPV